jgi:hypothetical protein
MFPWLQWQLNNFDLQLFLIVHYVGDIQGSGSRSWSYVQKQWRCASIDVHISVVNTRMPEWSVSLIEVFSPISNCQSNGSAFHVMVNHLVMSDLKGQHDVKNSKELSVNLDVCIMHVVEFYYICPTKKKCTSYLQELLHVFMFIHHCQGHLLCILNLLN